MRASRFVFCFCTVFRVKLIKDVSLLEDQDQNILRGVFIAISAFFFLASVGVFVKLAHKYDTPLQWMVFIQYFTSLLITLALASKNRFHDLKTTRFPLHLFRGFTGMLAFLFFVIAAGEIPLVNATLLNNTTPVFIPIIALIWLKSKIEKEVWLGIFIGLIGITLILKPHEDSFLNSGDLFGLLSGICLAFAYVAMKLLTKSESFITIMFYYAAVATSCSFPFLFFTNSFPAPMATILLMCSGISFTICIFLIRKAYTFADAVKISPFNYSVIVFAGIFGWLIFAHMPDIWVVIGILLVAAGGIISIRHHEKNNKNLKHHWLP